MLLGSPLVRPFLLRRHHFGRRCLRHGQTHISRKNLKKKILFIVYIMSLLQAASSDNSSTSWVFRRIGTHVVMCFIGMTKVCFFLLSQKNGRHFGCLFCQKVILPCKELFDFWTAFCCTHTTYIVKIELSLSSFFLQNSFYTSQSKWSSILGGPHSTPDDLLLKYKDLVKKGDQWFTDQVFFNKKCF